MSERRKEILSVGEGRIKLRTVITVVEDGLDKGGEPLQVFPIFLREPVVKSIFLDVFPKHYL